MEGWEIARRAAEQIAEMTIDTLKADTTTQIQRLIGGEWNRYNILLSEGVNLRKSQRSKYSRLQRQWASYIAQFRGWERRSEGFTESDLKEVQQIIRDRPGSWSMR